MRADGWLAAAGLIWSAVPAAAPPPAPAPELLEFLGEFTTADGEWVDPLQLQSTTADTNARPVEEVPQSATDPVHHEDKE